MAPAIAKRFKKLETDNDELEVIKEKTLYGSGVKRILEAALDCKMRRTAGPGQLRA